MTRATEIVPFGRRKQEESCCSHIFSYGTYLTLRVMHAQLELILIVPPIEEA
jgi:hypothetical protein